MGRALLGAAILTGGGRATLRAEEAKTEVAPAPEDAEAKGILEGIEKTRLAAKPFRVTGRHSARLTRDDERWQSFLAEHDDGKFRVRVTDPGGSTTISDGRQHLEYDGESSATIQSLDKPSSELGFDPLLLGISSGIDRYSDRGDYLSFRHRWNLKIVSRRMDDGTETVLVSFVDRYRQTRRLWVQPERGFRVLRAELELPLDQPGIPSVHTTVSEFRPEDRTGWVPRRIVSTYAPRGQVQTFATLELDEPEWGVEIPPSTWTVKGLELPIGEPVTDLRIHRRVGYWNGTGLQESLPRKSK